MRLLFVIPARGGSKGLPGKNIKPLDGKPLIHYSIETARCFAEDENICVSTDDLKIKDVVESIGLEVPFIRPQELATDTATSNDVILHALDFYKKMGKPYDYIILLQPTSPFRRNKDIQSGISMLKAHPEMIIGVCESLSNPYFTLFEEDENGFLQKSKSGNFTRRQDCPKVWEINGAFYAIQVKKFDEIKDISKLQKKKLIMDEISSIDIDTISDWEYAEYLLEKNKI